MARAAVLQQQHRHPYTTAATAQVPAAAQQQQQQAPVDTHGTLQHQACQRCGMRPASRHPQQQQEVGLAPSHLLHAATLLLVGLLVLAVACLT
jgi:hypothetical protein